MIEFPLTLEAALLKYLKKEFYQNTRRAHFIERPFNDSDLQFFAEGVAKLSDLFTKDRSQLNSGYLNQPALRAGYLLYFLPINFAKARYVFQRIPQDFWQKDQFRVLDLGSGPGSASFAFLHELSSKNPSAKVDLTLVDQSERALQDAQALLHHFGFSSQVSLKKIRSDLKHFRFDSQYDFILISHALNELRQNSATERAEWLLPQFQQHLSPEGLIALTEPALKRPARELMGLRDHLVEAGELRVLAPCLHESICPMLAATHNDWCHFYVEWREPEFLKKLDVKVKNDNRFLKVAYLLLGHAEFYSAQQRRAEIYRVVSNRMATRGKTELLLCGEGGRIRLTHLERDRSGVNEDIGRVRRGDLVELPSLLDRKFEVEGRARLGLKDIFRIL